MKSISKLLVSLFACINVFFAQAQYTTTFEVTNLHNASLTSKVNRNISDLLTELNSAQSEGRGLNFKKMSMTDDAEFALSVLWEVCPFRCAETEIVERGSSTSTGYQVRNIPVIMEPLKGERFEEDKSQEIVVNFNPTGVITGISFTINKAQYARIMRSSNPVDLYRRQIVLDFIEQFRTAYNRKDMDYLEKVYSDDALIITGNVIKTAEYTGIKYTTAPKHEYLNRLKGVFSRVQRINIDFEEIKVVKHDSMENYYGVTLKQYWNTDAYSDIGYLFLLMDFKDEIRPMIHVRTWQPDDPSAPLPKSEIFSLSDFDLR